MLVIDNFFTPGNMCWRLGWRIESVEKQCSQTSLQHNSLSKQAFSTTLSQNKPSAQLSTVERVSVIR
jgi:hypothetical protein